MPDRQSSLKAMLIGLDGADWSVIKPLVERGVLKEFGKWMRNGAISGLKSIIPPVTGPAWPALATGLNPGRLGTFDFANRRSLEDFTLHPIKSHDFRGKTIWDYLDRSGVRVGVFGFPQLSPTYPINGWMVSGFMTGKAQKWTWPYHLAQELESVAQPYTIYVPLGAPQYRNDPERLLDDLERMLVGQLAALIYLLERYPVNVLVAVLNITDALSHAMWHIWDETHPFYNQKLSANLTKRVEAIWVALDQGLQRIAQMQAPDGQTIVVSDHGFGPSWGVFHINVWLEQNGYLKRSPRKTGRLSNQVRARLVEVLTPLMDPLFKALLGSPLHLALRESLLREIDLHETRAFSLEASDVCGMVFINRAYARERGLHEQTFIQETCAEIIRGLQQSAGELGVKVETFNSKDLFVGDFAELAPELVLRLNDSAISVSPRFGREILEMRLHHPMKTGTHRQEGIFLLSGSKANAGQVLPTLNILDVAPTFYHLLGLPVPCELDGKVALESFAPQYRQVNQIAGSDISNRWDNTGPSKPEEFDELNDRLRSLGYLD